MKRSKGIYAILLSALLLFYAHSAFGQVEKLRNTTPEQRAKAQTMLMKRKLNLSPRQTGEVSAINLKYARMMEPVLKGSGGKLQKMREAKSIDGQKDAALRSVLSSGQFQTYLASKEEMREKVIEHLKEKHGARG
jgi:hypothetical protein